ncbi:MAG: peptidoglycan-binding protein [Clostridia bacterium]|nr:peptidoglycan-binding protein [Clostridia bacterium]
MKHAMLFRRLTALIAALILCLGMMPAKAEDYPFVAFATVTLNIRRQPNESAIVVDEIPQGDPVIVTGESGNYYIVVHEGTQGYSQKKYLVPRNGQNSAPSYSAPVYTAAPTAAPVMDTAYTLLYSGMNGQQVRVLQQALKELSFYTGSIDGDFGTGTKNAVISFQNKNGLPATGAADGAMQQLLFEGKPKNAKGRAAKVKTVSYLEGAEIASGAQGDAVIRLQLRLKELGYYTSTVDGECGPGTVNAIKKFQKKMGMKQTGKADAQAQALLYSAQALPVHATATPKPTATPTPVPTPTPTPVPDAIYPFTTYTLSSVNLRKGPSVDTSRLATVSKGAEITVLAMEGDFLKINYNGKTGYVMAQYVNVPTQYMPGKDLTGDSAAQQHYAYLQYGVNSKYVSLLKQALNELGFYSGAYTENFDSSLVSALKKFQKQNGIRQDGVATPEVQKLIYEGKPKNAKGKATNIRLLPPIEGYEMKLNDKGEAVVELQRMLRQMGHFDGVYSETFNSATQKAVKEFQKEHNLYVDGVVGAKTWRLLSALTAPTATPTPGNIYIPAPTNTPLTENNVIVMQNGTRGMAVTRLQERLVELGYYTITPDGIYNSDDIAAVKAFQRKNGVKIDGIAGLETQILLYSDAALPATSAPLPVITAAPTLAPTPVPLYSQTLRTGSRGEAVSNLQARLKELGYYNGTVDGLYGNGTARSVTLFQRANNLTPDGVAGEDTQKKLYSGNVLSVATPVPTKAPAGNTGSNSSSASGITATLLKNGDKGTDVKKLQQRLVDLGYLNAADGIYGMRTYNAVVAFQRKNGLTADGMAGKMTLNRLFSAAAIGANNTIIPDLSFPGQDDNQQDSSSSFRVPLPSEVRYANWFSEIRSRARLMPDVVIYDPDSGLHFNLHMFSFGKHADSEPPTAKDTEILYQINGKDNWDPKYVWVIFSDGRVYIASIHSQGHTVDHTSGNDMVGHICLHFPRIMSEAEATGPYAVRHQKEILYGWELTQALIR